MSKPENAFELVNRVRLRAMELGNGAHPRAISQNQDNHVTVAMHECKHGLVEFTELPPLKS